MRSLLVVEVQMARQSGLDSSQCAILPEAEVFVLDTVP